MAIVESEAYLIRKLPFRETSWLVTLLTRDSGKIKGIVKGARKLKSKLLSAFELLTHLNIIFYEKARSNLHLVSGVSILRGNEKIRKSFSSLTYGSYFAELIDTLLEEHDPQPAVFDLLASAVRELEKSNSAFEILARAFEFKLLESAGLSPHLHECMKCGASDMKKIYFSVAQGGLFCERCHFEGGGFLISRGTVEAINSFLDRDLAAASRLEFSIQISQELHQISKRFIERRIEKRLKGLQFIDEARRNTAISSLI